jgi:hypothetical protein
MQIDSGVLVAVVGLLGSAMTAGISYVLTKRQQLEAQWRESKRTHYQNLVSAISDVAVEHGDVEAYRRFVSAVNTIALVAPQPVVQAVLAWNDRGEKATVDQHNELLTRVMLTIRADLGITPKDDAGTFRYYLIGIPGTSATSDPKERLERSVGGAPKSRKA